MWARGAWTRLGAVLLAAGLAACASTPEPPAPPPRQAAEPAPVANPSYKVGKPYQVAGVWYYPRVDWKYDETGIASWYGDEFHNKLTANGELYDQFTLTAAHKTLPMPSTVRVTNLENGRTLNLRVNDRGPFVVGRIIDVSRRAAQLLGFEQQGTARVRVQVMAPADVPGGIEVPQPEIAPEERTVIATAPVGAITAAPLAPPPGQAGRPAAQRPVPQRPATLRPPPVERPPISAAPPPEPARILTLPVRATRIYVQAGAFTSVANANRLKAQLAPIGPTLVTQAAIEGDNYYRVRIGPMATVADADAALARVIAQGQTTARIVVD
ncbi:septal ring lytic transglycosylase RlpA family protein [Zavarzinia sp. CC-PAN008]|uniref:septal ring lytic transglycosylase RlpA family protein n=1 Tax=Zavarzinia sp. CC-PAN008 TaxID=3243332 RepID=UPI003F7478F9